jgi:hypothetical protein
VAAAVDGHEEVVLAGEVHAGLDVCGVSGAGDEAGTAVDHAVEDGTSGVVPGVRRADDLPAELAGESFYGIAGYRAAGGIGESLYHWSGLLRYKVERASISFAELAARLNGRFAKHCSAGWRRRKPFGGERWAI